MTVLKIMKNNARKRIINATRSQRCFLTIIDKIGPTPSIHLFSNDSCDHRPRLFGLDGWPSAENDVEKCIISLVRNFGKVRL
jgi:hypothetical protein